MNTEKKDHMKNDGAWKAVHEAFNTGVPEQLEKQLQNSLNAFRQDMREHPYIWRLERYGFLPKRGFIFFSRPLFRPFVLAGMGLAIVVVVGFLILGNNPPTWAQVQERFGSMPSFTASIYKRDVYWSDNPLIEPKLVEVWAGYGDRIRIRSGNKMTFGYKGEILNTFDLISRSEDYADSITYDLVNILGESHTNALDSLLMPFTTDLVSESISKEWKTGGPVDTTSLVISDSVASKDLVVFDREYFYFKSKSWMARVWVVRKSRLPVRIVMWHVDELVGRPIRSPFLDMMFTYSKEQPRQFFDPEAFATKLKDPAIGIESLVYMYHQFPAGDSIPDDK